MNAFNNMDHISFLQAIVDVVVNLQFSLIEALWQGFWRNQSLDRFAQLVLFFTWRGNNTGLITNEVHLRKVFSFKDRVLSV